MTVLETVGGPIVAVTDYMKAIPDQIARWVPGGSCRSEPTDSDAATSREALRRFFEIDEAHIVATVIKSLVDEGAMEPKVVLEVIERYGINPDSVPPEQDTP